ncbi:MAG: hypothetical protein IKG40_02005 [Bacilli bacterium]|nr:hypothetical protein [Bacilli bacterium]
MEIKELKEFNVKMFKSFINEEDDLYGFWNNFKKLLNWINNNIDIRIYRFGEVEDFIPKISDWNELVEFHNFYKSVYEDLSDSYYFKEPFEPIGFIKDSETLVEMIELMIKETFDKQESVAFNRFMVGLLF